MCPLKEIPKQCLVTLLLMVVHATLSTASCLLKEMPLQCLAVTLLTDSNLKWEFLNSNFPSEKLRQSYKILQ